jgi:hypothetical protein
MGWGLMTLSSVVLAAALAACASSTEENPAAGIYAKYDCGQIAALRGDVPNPKEHGTFRRDMDEIEAASKAKGCNIDFR